MTKDRQRGSARVLAMFGAAIALGAMGILASDGIAQTRPAAGPFTDAQAEAGRAIYTGRCASCHDAGGETGKLSGATFLNLWKTRTTRDLYTRIKTTMPFNDPGSLSDTAAASVVAYVLKSNGAMAGTADFTPATVVAINTL